MLTIVWFFGCAGNNFLREVKPILVISISQELISWFLVRIKRDFEFKLSEWKNKYDWEIRFR